MQGLNSQKTLSGMRLALGRHVVAGEGRGKSFCSAQGSLGTFALSTQICESLIEELTHG